MLRFFAAFLLAVLLAAFAYGIFWWGTLTLYGNEMQTAVERALHGELTYGKAQWVPDVQEIKVSLSNVRVVLRDSPILEVRAPHVVLSSGFFSRNQWTLHLPPKVEVVMASGDVFLAETKNGQLMWNVNQMQLSFRADELRVISVDEVVVAHINDVMVERRPSDEGVRLNLASRPDFGSGPALLSGQLVLPPPVMNDLMEAFGKARAPDLSTLVKVAVVSLAENDGVVVMDNISFRHGDISGAVYGVLRITPNGQLLGEAALTADSPARLLNWVKLINGNGGRNVQENRGWREVEVRLDKKNPAARMEVIPNGLIVNGFIVGPVPMAANVVSRIWP